MSTKNKALPGKRAILDNIMEYFSFSAIIILLLALSLTQENFLGEINLKNLLRDTAPLMIMAAGMTMVLLFGSIDLSMGAVCSVSNVAFVHFMLAYGESFGNPLLAGLAGLAVSLLFGLCSGLTLGFIHVKLKVPSFIASLGFMSVWQSVALLITQGPESMKKSLWPATDWYKISFGVVGLPLVLAIVIILLVYLPGPPVHGEGDGRQHEDAEHHVLPVGVHADEVHAVLNDGHGEHAQDGPQLAALASGQTSAPQGAGGHDLQGEGVPDGGSAGAQVGGQEHPGQGRQHPVEGKDHDLGPVHVDARHPGGPLVAANGEDGLAEGGEPGEQVDQQNDDNGQHQRQAHHAEGDLVPAALWLH